MSTTDQIVGSPTFIHLTDDSIPDIVIGGRSRNLMAINGRNGHVLWRYRLQSDGHDIKAYARFNFFNCQKLKDINDDLISDILVTNGGNVYAPPNSLKDRYPGTLMVLDGKTGYIIAIDTMPDGLETYCSPIVKYEGNKTYVIYGTGGETFGGHVFKVDFEDLKHNSLKNSTTLLTRSTQGFIAPPVLIDLNKDQNEEIIVSSHDGTVYAIDGKSNAVLWKTTMAGLEANNTMAPGYFNQDEVLDLLGFFTKGAWPHNNGIVEFVLNGEDGSILFQDTIGSIGFSSPISFQADEDKEHEVLIHINFSNGRSNDFSKTKSQLILYDFPGFKRIAIDTAHDFKNISTTPWVGDLDGDHKLEIITCYLKNTVKADEVLGMYISRFNTNWQATMPVWGAYMGTQGDSKMMEAFSK